MKSNYNYCNNEDCSKCGKDIDNPCIFEFVNTGYKNFSYFQKDLFTKSRIELYGMYKYLTELQEDEEYYAQQILWRTTKRY